MPLNLGWWRRKKSGVKTAGAAAVKAPEHFGDIWHALQEIAAEEDPRFKETSIVEHFNASGEGVKDVDRWLHIYRRRLDPAHAFSFPEHHPRHRGHVLILRNWPTGLRWEAFDETTWARAPLPPAPDQESLIRALDAHLDRRPAGEGA
jgi:hypothetical protein